MAKSNFSKVKIRRIYREMAKMLNDDGYINIGYSFPEKAFCSQVKDTGIGCKLLFEHCERITLAIATCIFKPGMRIGSIHLTNKNDSTPVSIYSEDMNVFIKPKNYGFDKNVAFEIEIKTDNGLHNITTASIDMAVMACREAIKYQRKYDAIRAAQEPLWTDKVVV